VSGDQVVDGIEVGQRITPAADELGGTLGLWLAAPE
jgi:hypothetical protein